MTVTIDDFRRFFPEFSEVLDEIVTAYMAQAELYISPDEGTILSGNKLKLAICLMAAHLLILSKADGLTASQLAMGSVGGVELSKSVGNVSTSKAAPPFTDNYTYWLNQTSYGQRFLALLESLFVTPMLTGGEFIRF